MSLETDDKSLATSAVSYLQTCKEFKETQEWNEFRNQFPEEAKWMA
jgi:hypothetical protein